MKLFVVVVVFLGFALGAQAQEVTYGGVTYKVKGKTILRDKENVTNSLSIEDQTEIRAALERQKAMQKERELAEKQIKKIEKDQKEAEKRIKQAEKRQKAAEKELKEKEKAQSKFENATKDYNKAIDKYERLRDKGKLSPNDEEKWLKKIDDLKEDIEKARRKL